MRIVLSLSTLALLTFATRLHAEDETKPTPKPLAGSPDWLKTYAFPQKEFTFVRIQFTSRNDRANPDFLFDAGQQRRVAAGRWATDYPDADLNLSAQLAAETSLKVDPKGKVMKLTDPKLPQFPFIYLCEPGALQFSEEEAKALRAYLDGGGFLMVDDFWGEQEWQNLLRQMARVFPSVRIHELPLEHKIFHCAFDLKEKPQVVSIQHFLRGRKTERPDAPEAHYRAIFDENGRMQVLICHNTDLGDGWERSEAAPQYFQEYSEKHAYPLGLNVIFFALTQKK
ncbi:MAG TPA: DUF4159 domain-containing protein [Planctomycetaceae bacterium]|nr:DUF4159 domain-containing protein [Planctomycetaceae bacterium]